MLTYSQAKALSISIEIDANYLKSILKLFLIFSYMCVKTFNISFQLPSPAYYKFRADY